MLYDVQYTNNSVKISKNVSPFPGGRPLWDTPIEYLELNSIPKDVLDYLGESVIDGICWFFEDIKSE
jgi:hypothetical protein